MNNSKVPIIIWWTVFQYMPFIKQTYARYAIYFRIYLNRYTFRAYGTSNLVDNSIWKYLMNYFTGIYDYDLFFFSIRFVWMDVLNLLRLIFIMSFHYCYNFDIVNWNVVYCKIFSQDNKNITSKVFIDFLWWEFSSNNLDQWYFSVSQYRTSIE